MNRPAWIAAIVIGTVTLSGPSAAAQANRDSRPAAGRAASEATPPAAAHDVESLDAILGALYDVISGPAAPER